MSIKDQETQSQLSLGTTTGGNPAIDSVNPQNNRKIRDNYGNISIATAGRGEVITQITPAKKSTQPPVAELNPLADALRVKLNLARSYITIEDFSAAKKSLEEIVEIGGSIDPGLTVEAQGLLAELLHRNN